MEATIRAEALGQGHGRKMIISGLDLELGSGVFGLLGPNGAGKTTLLRTLATITPPRAGKLEIAGQAVASERSARLARRQIGFLPQDFGFLPSFTVYDFVRYAAWLREVPREHVHASTESVIEKVGLADRSTSKMKSLSGGMVRRAGIAAALVGSPRLVLLDEPTVGLDPAQRLEFRQLIRSLTDTTVILSTHLVEDVAAVCPDIAVMSEGRFIFHGSPAELEKHATPAFPGDTELEQGYMGVLGQAKAGV